MENDMKNLENIISDLHNGEITFDDRVMLLLEVLAAFGRNGRSECPKVWEALNACIEATEGTELWVSEFIAWDTSEGKA